MNNPEPRGGPGSLNVERRRDQYFATTGPQSNL
jgi:hypothetical protein